MWGLLAVVALLWPARTVGLLDGLPLESTIANAVLIGVVFPSLLWFHPRFLRGRAARAVILALLLWKAIGAAALATDGWCVRFEPQRPLVKDATSNVPHSWDVRADWRSDQPACSAVVRRAYKGLGEFPVWFFNLPPPNDSWPEEQDRPPGARTGMIVSGFIDAARDGVLQLDVTPEMNATAFVDGTRIDGTARVSVGVHRLRVEAMLTGDRWRFEPRWNGVDFWKSRGVFGTITRPSRFDELVRPWGGWPVTVLAAVLIMAWTVSFLARIRAPAAYTWVAGASLVFVALQATGHGTVARAAVSGLMGAAFVPVPARLRNVFGAFVLIGVPWMTLIVAGFADQIGSVTWYRGGDDYWVYQRFGYRIVMQGYWLEGGTKQFYFQPFYRWVNGLLHLGFGDSSVGEPFWDGACLLAMALLAFSLTKAASGFRCGLFAAALTLTVVALGLPYRMIGRGLGEMTSAGFISLGAFLALRGRRGSLVWAVAAGILASLAFYTRLNNLPMALSVALFAASARKPFRDLVAARTISWRVLFTVPVVFALGLVLFAWRNWHFNGTFSIFSGTQLNIMVLWQPGTTFGALLAKFADSVALVVTVHDPPRLDWKSVPVMAGAVVAPLAIIGVARLRDVPALPALFFLAAISAAFVARGWAYEGRFSVHVIGVTCALAVIGVERVLRPCMHRSPISEAGDP